MIKAIIFDLDGTLIDLPIDWETLFDKIKKLTNIDNVRPLTITVPQTDLQTQKKAFAVWDEAEFAVAGKYTVKEEGMKIYCKNRGKPKTLVTMQGKKTVDVILNRMNLKFESVITREDSLNREKQLALALKKFKIPAKDILFVGNTDSDENAARKIGCQFHRIK